MSKREHRRFAADQPGVTVSEVCRRHTLSPSVLYRWRAVAQGRSVVAEHRDVPIMLVTVADDKALRQAAVKNGIIDFVVSRSSREICMRDRWNLCILRR